MFDPPAPLRPIRRFGIGQEVVQGRDQPLQPGEPRWLVQSIQDHRLHLPMAEAQAVLTQAHERILLQGAQQGVQPRGHGAHVRQCRGDSLAQMRMALLEQLQRNVLRLQQRAELQRDRAGGVLAFHRRKIHQPGGRHRVGIKLLVQRLGEKLVRHRARTSVAGEVVGQGARRVVREPGSSEFQRQRQAVEFLQDLLQRLRLPPHQRPARVPAAPKQEMAGCLWGEFLHFLAGFARDFQRAQIREVGSQEDFAVVGRRQEAVQVVRLFDVVEHREPGSNPLRVRQGLQDATHHQVLILVVLEVGLQLLRKVLKTL